MDRSGITYTCLVETFKRGMRRFVILFLLILLPIEVLAGISYEQRLALEAQHEAGEHHAHAQSSGEPTVSVVSAHPDKPLGTQAHAQDICLPTLAFDVGESDFSLDLGEAFDVPCQCLRKSTRKPASAPAHTGYCDKSIVAAVPTRPAI